MELHCTVATIKYNTHTTSPSDQEPGKPDGQTANYKVTFKVCEEKDWAVCFLEHTKAAQPCLTCGSRT